MLVTGYIADYDGETLTIYAPFTDQQTLIKQEITECEIRLDDGRTISADQRKKIYATIRDIADWSGHVPEFLKEFFKYDFIAKTGAEYFSLSDCDMTTAREFLNHILEFCIENRVPLTERLLERSPDIGRAIYYCLANSVCCICGDKADIHHVDAVGMGRDRKAIVHEDMQALPLCRVHHGECHNMGYPDFCKKYHVFAIRLDKYLCRILRLKAVDQ